MIRVLPSSHSHPTQPSYSFFFFLLTSSCCCSHLVGSSPVPFCSEKLPVAADCAWLAATVFQGRLHRLQPGPLVQPMMIPLANQAAYLWLHDRAHNASQKQSRLFSHLAKALAERTPIVASQSISPFRSELQRRFCPARHAVISGLYAPCRAGLLYLRPDRSVSGGKKEFGDAATDQL